MDENKTVELRNLLNDLIPLGKVSVQYSELNTGDEHEQDTVSYNVGYSAACKDAVIKLDKIIEDDKTTEVKKWVYYL